MRDGVIVDDGPSPRWLAAQAALIETAHVNGPDGTWEADEALPQDAELGQLNQELTH